MGEIREKDACNPNQGRRLCSRAYPLFRIPYTGGEVLRGAEGLDCQIKLKEAQGQKTVITEAMRKAGVEKAREIFPQRVEYYARMMGVSYGRITIREQKTRWGSCSGKGNLNFNWKLTLMPPEILDYVVVHELAHRKEMNHSRDFWKIVEQVLPDYQERRKRLHEFSAAF